MAEGGRNLRINPFTVDEDHIATGEKWDEWLEELEREMIFFRISDAADKKDAMLIYGGVGEELARSWRWRFVHQIKREVN